MNYPENNSICEEGVSAPVALASEGTKQELEYILACNSVEDSVYFYSLYESYVQKGEWKERTREEQHELLHNYIFAKEGEEVVGGYALGDYTSGKLLQCLFSTKKGIGKMILAHIQNENSLIYAYSKAGEFFEKYGFQREPETFSPTGAALYIYQREKFAN